mgnify:CR=1 FL=1
MYRFVSSRKSVDLKKAYLGKYNIGQLQKKLEDKQVNLDNTYFYHDLLLYTIIPILSIIINVIC